MYDVSPPYEETAEFCCDVQEADDRRAWVITSTNPERTARDLRARPEWYELIGKPYDLDHVVAAVHRAVRKTTAFERMDPIQVRRNGGGTVALRRSGERKTRDIWKPEAADHTVSQPSNRQSPSHALSAVTEGSNSRGDHQVRVLSVAWRTGRRIVRAT